MSFYTCICSTCHRLIHISKYRACFWPVHRISYFATKFAKFASVANITKSLGDPEDKNQWSEIWRQQWPCNKTATSFHCCGCNVDLLGKFIPSLNSCDGPPRSPIHKPCSKLIEMSSNNAAAVEINTDINPSVHVTCVDR